MTTERMNLFLKQMARTYRNEQVLMFWDQASSHRAQTLNIPKSMEIHSLPPYSPQLNPVEHLWDDLREKYFPNLLFDSIDRLVGHLCNGLKAIQARKAYIKSFCGFSWLVNCILNTKLV
ncbi:MAG: hypothetical protein GKR87_01030 [Kiritimatiellae bacterium]|nr:hypothetical protein [Kiritimatiellia bacterium]